MEEGKTQEGRKEGRMDGRMEGRGGGRGREGKKEKGRGEERSKSALFILSRQLASHSRTELISCWIKQIRSITGEKGR